MERFRFAVFLCMLLLASIAAKAQPEPRFDIRRFVVEGATLVSGGEIEAALGPFRGEARNFADVQRALEALERAYSTKGYDAVQVVLPEQEIARGEVRFKVIEARIGAMVIEGNRYFDAANIRASLPALSPGSAPNIHRIAGNLRLANESPAKQTTVLLRGGAAEGLVDALVRVADERPIKYGVTLDNTGAGRTGMYRTGFAYQHANVLNRDHVLSMQYVTAPGAHGHPNRLVPWPDRDVTIIGGSYRIPIYDWGDSIDLTAGYSNVDTGVLQNLFNVSGAGTQFGIKYNHALPRWRDLDHRVALGWDWRGFRGKVAPVGTEAAPAVSVHPVGILYSGVHRQASRETAYSLALQQNLPGGTDGGAAAIQYSRPGARPAYLIWRYGISHDQFFASGWQVRAAFNGQATRDRLVASEQFGIGGIDSVRGFLEREIVNDYGYRGRIEGHTPNLAGLTDRLSGYRVRGVVFYDWGRATRIEPLVSEPYRQSIAAAGFGVRLSSGTNLSVRLDYALVLDKGGLQDRGDARVHMSFAYRCCPR